MAAQSTRGALLQTIPGCPSSRAQLLTETQHRTTLKTSNSLGGIEKAGRNSKRATQTSSTESLQSTASWSSGGTVEVLNRIRSPTHPDDMWKSNQTGKMYLNPVICCYIMSHILNVFPGAKVGGAVAGSVVFIVLCVAAALLFRR